MTSYGGNTYTYGLNGELATKSVNGKVTKYTYDVFGNLTKVVLPDNRTNEYLVDGRNRRIGKKVDGVFTEGYIYSGQLAVIAKTDGNGEVTDKYVPGGVVKNGVTYRVITDYLGSPRVAVNSDTGEVVAAWDWDEYGNLAASKNPDFLPFGFAGGLKDNDTGLIRFGARDYDLESGRWLSKEPLGFDGSKNFYSYCNGDPVNYIDIDGEAVQIAVIIGVAEVGVLSVFHYGRNVFNKKVTYEEAIKQKWIKLYASETVFHQFGKGNENNIKYISPDGHSEAVFRPNPCTGNFDYVDDSINGGTFNLFGPESGKPMYTPINVLHGVFDVVPYMLLGNSPSDIQMYVERFIEAPKRARELRARGGMI